MRSITAVLFFNPLKYLLTAGKDGSSEVPLQFEVSIVFVGFMHFVGAFCRCDASDVILNV